MDMSFINSFEKEIAAIDGITSESAPPRYWFSFGNYAINYVISGDLDKGIPQGRIIGITGPSGAGKSFLQCNATREAQKEGAYVLMIDSENALDDSFTTKLGINVEEAYSYKSVCTITHTIKTISLFIKGYRNKYGNDPHAPKVLIVIDSLDMLATDTEMDHFSKGDNSGDQGQRAKQLKAMLRQFVQAIKDLNISIVCTCQVYEAKQDQLMEGNGKYVVTPAVKYSLSQILMATRLKLKDGADIIGIRLKVEGYKTRFTQPFQNVVVEVPYETGMDPCSGLCEILENVGILVARGAYKQIVDTDIKFFKKNIADHLDILKQKFKELTDVHITIATKEDEEDESQPQKNSKTKRKENIANIMSEIDQDE